MSYNFEPKKTRQSKQLPTREEALKQLGPLLLDTSLWTLVAGNLVSIYFAFAEKWPLGEILWIYWAQSVIIGISNFIRIQSLKEFTTEGLMSGGEQVPETEAGKQGVAWFFLLHYGFFHLVYFMFLSGDISLIDIPREHIIPLLTCVIGFALSHGYSLIHNEGKDFRDMKPDLGLLMFYPYIRIVPMHFIIIFGNMVLFFGEWTEPFVIVIFMVMKTIADCGMHLAERFLFQAPAGFFDPK